MKFRPRVIPCLLLRGTGLVKTERFKDPRYLGDPVNVVRIFNDKGVDELMLLDIDATTTGIDTDGALLQEIASEAFVPVSTGGGVRTLDAIRHRLSLGFEKVVISSAAETDPGLIERAADTFGSSTITVVIDVRKRRFGRNEVVTRAASARTGRDAVEYAREIADRGAGEIVVQSVDRDGTMTGYDLELVGAVAHAVDVPVVALGGAGSIADISAAIDAGASAVAAGSMFVFQGPRRAVLINYPTDHELARSLPGPT